MGQDPCVSDQGYYTFAMICYDNASVLSVVSSLIGIFFNVCTSAYVSVLAVRFSLSANFYFIDF